MKAWAVTCSGNPKAKAETDDKTVKAMMNLFSNINQEKTDLSIIIERKLSFLEFHFLNMFLP